MSFDNTASDMSLKVVHALASIDKNALEPSVCSEYDSKFKGVSFGMDNGLNLNRTFGFGS